MKTAGRHLIPTCILSMLLAPVQTVASLMPYLRHSSGAESPIWCSFKIPAICSSENLERFVACLLSGDTLTSVRGQFRGADHGASLDLLDGAFLMADAQQQNDEEQSHYRAVASFCHLRHARSWRRSGFACYFDRSRDEVISKIISKLRSVSQAFTPLSERD